MHPVIRDVAALGDKAKVIRIDVDKNKELAEALRIKGLPTLMIYKDGQMIWRQSGELDANSIITIVQEQCCLLIYFTIFEFISAQILRFLAVHTLVYCKPYHYRENNNSRIYI
jgi:thioredoxin 1